MVLEKKRLGVQPQNGIPGFSLHFPKEIGYGYLRFEGNGKIPLEGREKSLPSWLSHFSFAKLIQPTGQSFKTWIIFFEPT